MATPMLSYDPPANEIAFYEKLFTIADPAHVGQIQGRDAVGFLSRSTLPMEALKGIWVMADTNPTTNSLDKRKFFTAVRLIQLSQNGKTATGPTLLVPEGTVLHPPYFDGMAAIMATPITSSSTEAHGTAPPTTTTITTAPSATVSVPSQGTASNNTLALTDPYMMQPGDQSKYETVFPQYEQEGFVYGQAAVTLFSKSGLDNDILRDIWNMVDNPVDNRLSKLEFAIAMHLIVCISKKNLPMPATLPPSLEALKKAEIMRYQQQQQQLQPHLQPTHAAVPTTPPRLDTVTTSSPHASARSMAIGRMSIGEAFDDLTPQPNLSYMPHLQQQGDHNAATSQQIPTMTDMPSSSVLSQRNVSISNTESGHIVTTMAPSLSIAKPHDVPPPPSLHNTWNEGNTWTDPSSSSTVAPTPNVTTTAAKFKLTEAGYSTHVASTSAEEVMQLRSILQTLQAENISLKAQVGQFSDEEKQVRAEITHTSAEIVTLLHDLTGLRNRVAQARIQLLEATAELKVVSDKKEALKELISEEEITLSSIHAAVDNVHEAFGSLQQIKHQEKGYPNPPQPVPPIVEHNFFDMDSFVQVQQVPPPPPMAHTTVAQPTLMEAPHEPAQTPSDFIVYPVPEIPEYHPGNLMGGTSLSTVNRMGAGSVDGLSVGGEYSIASAHSAPNYYWNPSDEYHEEHRTPSTVAIPADNHTCYDTTNGSPEKVHSKDSKKWGSFLRRGGKHTNTNAADF